jgi:hypothetical protein
MVDRMDDDGGPGRELDSIVAINNLNYAMEPDLSVATNATYKKHFFTNETYDPHRSAICILNSGADYLDFRRSMLAFDFELTVNGAKNVEIPYNALTRVDEGCVLSRQNLASNTLLNLDGQEKMVRENLLGFNGFLPGLSDNVRLNGCQSINSQKQGFDFGFGNGSACNLINRITIQSRSGDEICRIENSALLSHIMTNYCYSQEWMSTVGSGFGAHAAPAHTVDGQGKENYFHWKNVTHTASTKCRFQIPLYILSGFFNYDRLMPSMLCSGLRIAIEWNEAPSALVFSTNPTECLVKGTELSWEVSKVTIEAKSIQLTDACQRYLNEVSATTGLELVYTDFNHTGTNIVGSSSDLHTEIRHACSRALRAFGRIRDQNANRDYTRDSFAADYWMIPQYQWRLGSLYFPQQPTQAKNTNEWKDSSMCVDLPVDHYTQYYFLSDSHPTGVNNAYLTMHNARNPGQGGDKFGAVRPACQSFKRLDIQSLVSTLKSGPKHLDNIKEAYYHSLEMFGKLNPKSGQTSVSLDQFCEGEIPLLEGRNPQKDDRFHRDARAGPVTFAETASAQYASGVVRPDCLSERQNDFNNSRLHGYFNSSYAASRTPKQQLSTHLQTNHVKEKCLLEDTQTMNIVNETGRSVYKEIPKDSYKKQFMNSSSYTSYPGCQAIIPVSLERSTLFALSGVPINNSRVLGLDYSVQSKLFGTIAALEHSVSPKIDIESSNSALSNGSDWSETKGQNVSVTKVGDCYYPQKQTFSHTNNIFLQYVKIARVFLNNVEVEQ